MLFFVLVNLLFSCSVISREEIKHNGNGKEVIEFRQQHSWAKIQTKTVGKNENVMYKITDRHLSILGMLRFQ